jgi:hypothetical protein
MHHLIAQHDFEVMVKNVLPLIPFVSGPSCEEGTKVLVRLLGEALESQDAALKRADELKKLKPKGLMELFKPEGGKPVAHREPLAISPRASAPAPVASKSAQKRPRKEKVGEPEPKEGVKKPKEREPLSLQKIIQNNGVWDPELYPRIVQVTKCDGGEGGMRIEVHVKKQGRGQWQETIFTLNSAQLSAVGKFPQSVQATVKTSFQKSLTDFYGLKWPEPLVAALSAMPWARDILPHGADADADVRLMGAASLSSF